MRVFDNDLEGPCGLHHIRRAPGHLVRGGIMERGNFSAAAGFGSSDGKQGLFATFSAFLEMCISEITMARLNYSNVLAHFSHSGVDDMADNTCHFGINSIFADGGVQPGHGEDATRLYFPVDQHQFAARQAHLRRSRAAPCSARAPVPDILGRRQAAVRRRRSSPARTTATPRAALRGRNRRDRLPRADAVIGLGSGVKVGLITCRRSTSTTRGDEKLTAALFVPVAEAFNVKTVPAAASAASY